jgi:hypothetical protein
LVRTESAPPSVLRPNTGFEPDMSVTVEMADCGIKSQFTVSPKDSLMRTPST